jgi:hypothetical protein
MASTSTVSKPLVVLEDDDDDLIEDSPSGIIPYEYDSLPDAHYFRVIELLPGEHNSRLECHITSHLLDDAQRVNYRAISYTVRPFGRLDRIMNKYAGRRKMNARLLMRRCLLSESSPKRQWLTPRSFSGWNRPTIT